MSVWQAEHTGDHQPALRLGEVGEHGPMRGQCWSPGGDFGASAIFVVLNGGDELLTDGTSSTRAQPLGGAVGQYDIHVPRRGYGLDERLQPMRNSLLGLRSSLIRQPNRIRDAGHRLAPVLPRILLEVGRREMGLERPRLVGIGVDGAVCGIVEQPDLFVFRAGSRHGIERAQEGTHLVEQRDVGSRAYIFGEQCFGLGEVAC